MPTSAAGPVTSEMPTPTLEEEREGERIGKGRVKPKIVRKFFFGGGGVGL